MFIIAGLGNPEGQYKNTRHNIGFEVINKLSYDYNISINKAKFRGHVGEGNIKGKKVLLLKPQTFMNLSGESIISAMSFYKLAPERLIVIYDDCAINIGEIRIRTKGSAGSHNGMKNILYHLETDEFLRVRVGIGEKPSGYDLADYVLSRFKPAEQEYMVDGVTKATDAVVSLMGEDVQSVMNIYNKKNRKEGSSNEHE